jgi:pilus assembly protein CpaB
MPKRFGFTLIVGGLALAVVAAVLVMGIARQARAASYAPIKQVNVVVTNRDVTDGALVTADALDVKAFPADFAPAGAYSVEDDVIGKYAQGFIPKGQVVVAGQLQLSQPAPLISDRIEPGSVVFWLPMPDVLTAADVLKPGDHIDVLLTAPIKATSSNSDTASTDASAAGLSTQTTLQNIEIYRIGTDELNNPQPQTSPKSDTTSTSVAATPKTSTGKKSIGLLVNHQDAVVMKFVKDAGGTIDLVTRSTDDQQNVRTESVTLDSLVNRFQFRVPQAVQPATALAPRP